MRIVTNSGAGAATGRRLAVVVAVLLAALLIAASPVSAAVQAPPEVPFEASVEGTVSPVSEDTFSLAATGIARHMGLVDYEGHVQITSEDPDTGVITNVLTETLTAANGDTLTIECEQIAVPVGPGQYQGTDQWTVTGGTGRFSGATGSGTGDTYVDLNSGSFSKELSGSISY